MNCSLIKRNNSSEAVNAHIKDTVLNFIAVVVVVIKIEIINYHNVYKYKKHQ